MHCSSVFLLFAPYNCILGGQPSPPPQPPKEPLSGLVVNFTGVTSQDIEKQLVQIDRGQKKTYTFEVARTDQIEFDRGSEAVVHAGASLVGLVSASIEGRFSNGTEAGLQQEQRKAASVQIDGDICNNYRIERIRNFKNGIVSAPNLDGGVNIGFKFLESIDINAVNLCANPSP